MAHYQQQRFVQICKEELPFFFRNSKVLEVGSWDTSGTIRNIFEDCDYVGVDIAEGPGVDLVSRGEDLSFNSASFDVVVSCECFEHNREWIGTFANMIRMLRPGGLCIVSCAWLGRSEHGTPRTSIDSSLTALADNDAYYGNLSASDFKQSRLLQSFDCLLLDKNLYSRDLYFVGLKKEVTSQVILKMSLKKIKDKLAKVKASSAISPQRLAAEAFLSYSIATVARFLGENRFHDFRYYMRKAGIKVNRSSLIHS
jgi:SAM-dependent methyltransferase